MVLEVASTIERQTATISSSVVAITAAGFGFDSDNLAVADAATITCFTATVVFSDDGTDPAADDGHAIAPLSTLNVLGNDNINALRFIRQGSDDGVVCITLKRAGRVI